MCEVFSTSWGFLVDFKRFLFVQFVGRGANHLGQSDGKKILNFTRILLWFSMDFFSILPENQLSNVRNSRIISK